MNKPTFLEELERRVLVCDGAMGTMLYARGVFLNRSFDELNLTQPDLVTEVHHAYVRAGADVIETNTFGANRIKLSTFGLADRTAEINTEGARLARRAAHDQAFVAGAIGPLGVRIEPWGKTGIDEAETYFREQAAALLEGGVELFVLETFRDRCRHPRGAQPVVAPDCRAGDDGRGWQYPGRRGPRAFHSAARRTRRHRRRPELQRRAGRDARDDRAHRACCEGPSLRATERRTAA